MAWLRNSTITIWEKGGWTAAWEAAMKHSKDGGYAQIAGEIKKEWAGRQVKKDYTQGKRNVTGKKKQNKKTHKHTNNHNEKGIQKKGRSGGRGGSNTHLGRIICTIYLTWTGFRVLS